MYHPLSAAAELGQVILSALQCTGHWSGHSDLGTQGVYVRVNAGSCHTPM